MFSYAFFVGLRGKKKTIGKEFKQSDLYNAHGYTIEMFYVRNNNY